MLYEWIFEKNEFFRGFLDDVPRNVHIIDEAAHSDPSIGTGAL
jgi:hypothetical protein